MLQFLSLHSSALPVEELLLALRGNIRYLRITAMPDYFFLAADIKFKILKIFLNSFTLLNMDDPYIRWVQALL